MKSECKSMCCDDIDCPCWKICDEGDYCENHWAETERYWAGYFGLKQGTSAEVKNHNRKQLIAFTPPGYELDVDY